jgi:hypothetical protein
MTSMRRLKAFGAFLVLAAVITTAHVWSEPAQQKQGKRSRANLSPDPAEQTFVDDLASAKFAKGGVLTYRTSQGELLFALQLKPTLEAVPSRPCDYLIMVDTSASQAQGPLAAAITFAEGLVAELQPSDRASIWTVNIPTATKSLSRGFQSGGSDALRDAVSSLKQEVPLGDTDLKGGLKKAMPSFEHNPERQQVIVFLGDGMSIHDPITAADRAALCEEMVRNDIQFYSVPVGPRFDPANVHGLATATGGEVVRFQPQGRSADAIKSLKTALSEPLLKAKGYDLGPNVVEAFPSTLPPIRSDAPTLVVGKMKEEGPINYKINGTVQGKEIRVEGTANVTDSDPDNFFLVSMVDQWKNNKEQPAATRADRVLAYAYEQTRLAQADLLAQAEWAMGQDKLEAAQGLFLQTKKLNPQNIEADAGLKIVDRLKSGAINKEKLREQLAQDKNGLRAITQATPPQPPPPPPGQAQPPAVEQEDLLSQQRRRIVVEEQRVAALVDEAQRQARRLLSTDPDAARDLLKRAYATVRDNPDLTDRVRLTLSSGLEDTLRNIEVEGARIKQDRERAAQALADARRRQDLDQARQVEEERTRARLQRFANLMNQARFEDAYQVALSVIQDAQNSGRPIPPAATAAYNIGLTMNNLSQLQELKRVREERWLLVLMQAERSHVPFPDEPPIQFPPAQIWRELTKLRKEQYENSGFTDPDPATLRKIREMKAALNRSIDLEKGIEANTPLKDALEFISDRFGITILIDTQAFKSDLSVDAVEDQPVKLPKMTNVSLGTVLRMLTAQINGTWLVRRDYVEITTGQRMVVDKVLRVYPVADLVIPIPNSFNQRVVNQSLTILGTAPGLGLQLGSPAALGGIASGVGLGAGLGALGAGLGFGGFGALGQAAAGGGFGGFGGLPGVNAQGGQVNLGFGGGNFGFGGGQLGQFGNLGGQFGLQGGDQSTLLVTLIRQVVGNQREWQQPGFFQRPAAATGPVNPAGQQAGVDDDEAEKLNPEQLNSLGYYPPARALIVKGTSRYHTDIGGGLLSPRPGGNAAISQMGDGKLAIVPKDKRRENEQKLAQAKQASDKKLAAKTSKKPADLKELAKLDPKQIWQDALAKGVNDPGLIIACVDFLAQAGRYDHVVEFLKADLRQGIVVKPWVYEALALALEASGGSPEMIERAYASAVDLEPQDASGYVRASKAMGDRKLYDRAVAYCRQAALLEPNSPASYEEAMLYADLAQDSSAMQWAAGNLLRRDWPSEDQNLHEKAQAKLRELAGRLRQAHHSSEADRMVTAADKLRERDLVIELTWEGEADLDLEVKEPIGTVCSFLQRQSPGGGTLLGDGYTDAGHESYVAAKAFSGDYHVTVRRIWGRPMGGKANLEIIEHMGTARENRRRETIAFDRKYTMSVAMADGRRTKTEFVPPPAVKKKSPERKGPSQSDSVLARLRMEANPEFAGEEYGPRGGASTLGAALSTPSPDPKPALPEQLVYETKVAPMVDNGTDFTMQVSVSPDDGMTRMKLSPVFQTVNATQAPTIHNPYLPDSTENSGVP